MKVIKSRDRALAAFNGQEVVNQAPLSESQYDREEVGPMFTVMLAGGAVLVVFGDEVVDR